jgi:DegV family protein with EDD domain
VIGFCIDSNAQLPAELAQRYGVEIVPLTVTIDGHEFVEGVDLDADEFYARFATAEADGRPAPVVTTAAPSPGRFVVAYEALAQRGATEILSVHLGSAFSGTVNAARLAAGMGDVPVRIVDTVRPASPSPAVCGRRPRRWPPACRSRRRPTWPNR